MIHSDMKQMNIFMSEWVIQSFTQTICSKALIHSGMKQQHFFFANSVLASFGSVFIDGAEMDKVTGNIVYEM